MRVREYHPSDREGCLAVLESNTPDFFLPEEEADFAVFLDRLQCRFFLVEDGGKVLACGGYHVQPDTGTAKLDWGMVSRTRHLRGLGRLLLVARLYHLATETPAKRVTLNTSQYSRGFFEREGFVVVSITPDSYGPGIHLHEMQLDLTPQTREAIARRWAEQRKLWKIPEVEE